MINRGHLFLLSGLMVLLSVVGCSRKVTSTTTEVTDSVHVREVPRFITITEPGDTVVLERMIECDSITNKPKPFTTSKKSGRASVTLSVDESGKLTSTNVYDSLHKVIKVMDKEIYRLKHTKQRETVTVTEYKKRSFDSFTNWWFAITAIVLICFIFFQLKKFF